MRLQKLMNDLGVKFNDISILETALTHSTYANEHNTICNERLEYLGDAVLELAMSNFLYLHDPLDEGVLTKRRAQAVCEEALNVYAAKIDLKDYIRFGNGEISNSLRDRPAIIADAFEAVLGAIYLDQGFDVVLRVVDHLIIPYLNEVWNLKDYKSILQEKVQSDKRSLHYEIIKDTGPAHDKTFEAVVYMDDDILMGHGFGKTKKEAEQQAAREALQKEAKI